MAKKIYTLDEWKLLDYKIRIDIIPIVERVKKGSEVFVEVSKQPGVLDEEQDRLLSQWLEKSNLNYRQHGVKYYICRDESLLDKLWKDEIGIDDFLSYPKCCIKNHRDFEKKFLQYINNEISIKELPMPQGVILGKEILKAIKQGTYDSALNYVPHIPCSAYCKKSIEFGRKIKECLEKNDPEVAEWVSTNGEYYWKDTVKTWNRKTWHKFARQRKKYMKSFKK